MLVVRGRKNPGWLLVGGPKQVCIWWGHELKSGELQYVSKSGKLSSGHRTGKGQFSFQSQRRAMPKNVQTTIQLHSSHMLARICSKSFNLGFRSTWELPDVQVGFREGRGTRNQIAKIHGIIEKAREFQKKMPTSASLTTLKPLTVVDHKKLWKILKERNTRPLTCLLKNLYAGQ